MKYFFVFFLLFGFFFRGFSQDVYALNAGWSCKRADSLHVGGEVISTPSFKTTNWLPATVPGTVLTTLLDNKLMPDPFFGMNNEWIPDIYNTGPVHIIPTGLLKILMNLFPHRVTWSG